MRPPNVSASFVWVIVACGVFTLLFIIGNLWWWGLHRHPAEPHFHIRDGSARLGAQAALRYGCGGCHVIPGLMGATGRVGPSLEGIHRQIYVGGVLENSPENMARWIADPQKFSPGTAMPDLGVTEEEAKHIAAFLYRQSGDRWARWRTLWPD